MQFTPLLVAAVALVSSVTAQDFGGAVGPVQFTNSVFSTVTVGQKFTITYANASGPVTIDLVNGPATNFKVFEQVATGLPSPSGSFDWTPEKSLPKDTYALYVSDGKFHNFGALFQPIGATAEPSSSAAASSTDSSSGSSSGTSASATSSATTTGSVTSTATDSSSTKSASTSGSKTSAETGSKTASQTSPTTSVPGAANNLSSPLALVLLGLVAVFSFN